MTAAERVFLDTNILIYASFAASPWHEAASAAVERHVRSGAACISPQICREYLAAATRTATDDASLRAALSNLAAIRTAMPLLVEDESVADELQRLLGIIPCHGRQIHDANIVATMRVHAIPRLLTRNESDFSRFSGLIQLEVLADP